jgi:hypothetical protein
MTGANKRKRHLNTARKVNKQRWTEKMQARRRALNALAVDEPDSDCDLVEDGPGTARAAVHWDDLDTESDSESEDEIEMTEEEDNAELDGNSINNLDSNLVKLLIAVLGIALDAVPEVYLQQSRIFENKKDGYRKSWKAAGSWLFSILSSTVNLILLSGTGVDASGMPARIASILLLVLEILYPLPLPQSLLLRFIATIIIVLDL